MHITTPFALIALLSTTGWAAYVLEDDYFAAAFFDQFTFWDTADPTHGFVEYKAYGDALKAKLISNTSTNVYMGVDHTNKCPTGRPSVRITSKKSYNFGLVVVDVDHMPGGICGTWPAFWMLGPNWPNNGEIDVIEGINEQPANDMTLHTGPGCTLSDEGGFSGVLTHDHCASGGDNNTGCQIAAHNESTNTYGKGFNANHGGIYATEWTSDYIKIWFFPRGACPEDALGDCPTPASWGKPLAYFAGACDFGTSFESQQIVFDTTFCGDWAGNEWNKSTCAGKAKTCNSFVENNPEVFKDAYWSVNALKVYQNHGGSAPSISTYIATSTSVQYVTQPEASYVAKTTLPASYPTTLAVSTKVEGFLPVRASTASTGTNSPSETGTSYAPVVNSDGRVEYGSETTASPPSYTGRGGGGGRTFDAKGVAGYDGGKGHDSRRLGAETRQRHARHLRAHKRYGKGRL